MWTGREDKLRLRSGAFPALAPRPTLGRLWHSTTIRTGRIKKREKQCILPRPVGWRQDQLRDFEKVGLGQGRGVKERSGEEIRLIFLAIETTPRGPYYQQTCIHCEAPTSTTCHPVPLPAKHGADRGPRTEPLLKPRLLIGSAPIPAQAQLKSSRPPVVRGSGV